MSGRDSGDDASSRPGARAQLRLVDLEITETPAVAGDLNNTDARERAMVFGDTTTASGGRNRVVLSRQGLETAMTKLAAELAGRYDVVYGRPESLVPPQKLKVEVKRSGTKLVAPSWPGR